LLKLLVRDKIPGMSIENLLDPRESAAIIAAENKRILEKSGATSPVYIVANAYIRNASHGIKSIARKYQRPRQAAASEEDFIKQLPLKERQTVSLNRAGLIFGISLLAIEDALIERVVEPSNIAAEYNFAVSGTPFENAEFAQGTREQIPDDKWGKMIQCATGDRTLGSFFGEEFSLLPESVRCILLKNSDLQGIIVEMIVPTYRDQVRTLIAKNGTAS